LFLTIDEAEPNDSSATAQDIDNAANWSLDFDRNIGDRTTNTSTTIPHVSIQETGDGTSTVDFFSFTVVNANDTGIFDIDYGYIRSGFPGSFNSYIRLYDTDGVTLLASNNDSISRTYGQGGSVSPFDSYLEYTFPSPGIYFIAVLASPGTRIPSGSTYTLQVSLQNHAIDTDGDGQTDDVDTDDDNDGVPDGSDPQPTNPKICGLDADIDTCDDCAVGVDGFGPLPDNDPTSDGTDTDGDGQCNTGDSDDDNDGVPDGSDPQPTNPNICGLDADIDTCDDCAVGVDGFGPLPDNDPTSDGPDTDGDVTCNAGDLDDDNDGEPDASDSNDADPRVCRDADGDICDDCSQNPTSVASPKPWSVYSPSTSNDGTDDDGDGFCVDFGYDCDDTRDWIYPGAAEVCDRLDSDCDGYTPPKETDDNDGDGFVECEGDCNNFDPETYPGATELCDGVDNDCDGEVNAPSGGPVVTGYSAIHSDDPAGPTYAPKPLFAATPLGLLDDEVSGAVPIGFDFDFYGDTYTELYVSSNGFVSFDPSADPGCCSGKAMPDPLSPNNLIAFWWEDLSPELGGTIEYETQGSAPNRVFVLEFSDIPYAESPAPPSVTLQLHLYEATNVIEMHYIDAQDDSSGNTTVGVENTAGDEATAFYNAVPGGLTELSTAIRFTPTDTETDHDGDGFRACEECNDTDPTIYPGATELCNGIDDDCNGFDDMLGFPGSETDDDGDGLSECELDCDDGDINNYPGNAEFCDGQDNDCNGFDDVSGFPGSETDNDFDGQSECQGDCNDGNDLIFTGAEEICDGLDNDCDLVVPSFEIDDDGDGQTECEGDCDDSDINNFTGNTEVCDGQDNDCSNGDDVLGFNDSETDNDGDGLSECELDCDDADINNYPGNTEVCDGQDNDCNGLDDVLGFDDSETDNDGDNQSECEGDCNDGVDTIYTGAEEALCDGIDQNCNGLTDDDQNDDNDPVSLCFGDCDDEDPDNYPGNIEICDRQDNNCDGQIPSQEEDNDEDGQTECEGDCDDDDPANFTGNDEACDGQDNDCNGLDDVLGFAGSETDDDGDGQSECEEDCDDDDINNYTGNEEACDGQDNDCNGEDDFLGFDGSETDNDLDGISECDGDCDDDDIKNFPGNDELCDDQDNDCDEETTDGSDEEWFGVDCDGADADLCEEGVFECTGGNQTCSDDTGDNEEVCDLEDNDCDGETDEDLMTLTTAVSPVDAGFVEPDCSGEGCLYECFTEVDLVAVAGSGNAFDNWSVCDDASDRFCSITMDDNIDTTANFMECETGFNDVAPGFWAEDAILLAACNNVIFGCDTDLGLYCSPEKVTRANLAAYVIRALYGEDFSYSGIAHFLDVPDTYWGFRYIQRMFEDGIVSGCGAGNYCPTGLITRAEASVAMVRALYGDSFTYNPAPYFSDVPDTHWAFMYIQKLVDDGVISGFGDGTFRPGWKITRAQIATMVSKAFLGM
jgi:hypothetical protein